MVSNVGFIISPGCRSRNGSRESPLLLRESCVGSFRSSLCPRGKTCVSMAVKKSLPGYLLELKQDRGSRLKESSSILAGQSSGEDLASLIGAVGFGCKRIRRLLTEASLREGEELYTVTKANSAMKSALWRSGRTRVIASRDDRKAVMVNETYAGEYICVFDALSGFEGLSAGIPQATVFGIYRRNLTCLASDWEARINEEELACLQMTLQPGANLIAAGYCVYSASSILVLSLGSRVDMFVLDEDIGEFSLAKTGLRVPSEGSTYSFEESNSPIWDEKVQSFVESLRDGGKNAQHHNYETRFTGSVVADVHNTLLHGGLYGSPGDRFERPHGELPLIYHCAPLAMVIETAGGMTTNGHESVLDLLPKSVLETTPFFAGSATEVKAFLAFLQNEHSVHRNR